MVCAESITLSSLLLTTGLSLCFVMGQVLTMTVNTTHVLASLTLTVNSGFALTTVNTVNKWCKSLFYQRSLVDDEC